MILYGPNAEPIVCTQYKLGIGFYDQWLAVSEPEQESGVEGDRFDVDAISTIYLDTCDYGHGRRAQFMDLGSFRTEQCSRKPQRPPNETTIKSIYDAIFGIGNPPEMNPQHSLDSPMKTNGKNIPAKFGVEQQHSLSERVASVLSNAPSRPPTFDGHTQTRIVWTILKVLPNGIVQKTGITVMAQTYGAALTLARLKARLLNWNADRVDVERFK